MNFEKSHIHDIDQRAIAKDRAEIETKTHEHKTTWDDVAAMADMFGKFPTDEEKLQNVLSQMDRVGSFGKSAREGNISSTKEFSRSINENNPKDNKMSIIDISNSF